MADPAVSPARVRFGVFELDRRARELRKGSTRLKVPDQSIAVLMALLERPGDLVGGTGPLVLWKRLLASEN